MILGISLVIVLLATYVAAQPLGANLQPGSSSRGTNPSVQSTPAQAGNVSALNIDQSRITDVWQGYYGNVSGSIVLENAGGDTFYDWTSAETTGEVYATRNTITDWSNINCTNSSQWESEESTLGISSTATDGVNETYYTDTHPSFMVGTDIITNCPSTQPYNSSGAPGLFWNVLLNTDATTTVYASIITDNANAFDNSTVDFEILVPVNRTTGFSTYYFYAELD